MYKILALVLLDLTSKILIFNLIPYNKFIKVASFLDIVHIHNFGISFGFFSELQLPWVFIIIGTFITFIIFIMYMQSNKYLEKIGFIIIISGAISNIIDRIINGFVIDFLYFHYKNFYWPAFNFADIYITFGVILIIIQIIKDLRNKKV